MGRARTGLFVSERGQPLTRQAINYLFASAAGRAGLEGVHPHMLRHTCGFALAKYGCSRKFIKDQLGHRAPKHAATYLPSARGSSLPTRKAHRGQV